MEQIDVSPQREKGHVDFANEIIDRLCKFRIPGQEMQIIWVIIRKTWGYCLMKNGEIQYDNKGFPLKKRKDIISCSQFAKMTGIDRRNIHKLLQNLIIKKIITKSVINIDDKKVARYGFNKVYSEWKLSSKSMTKQPKKKQKKKKVVKKPVYTIEMDYVNLLIYNIQKWKPNFPKPTSLRKTKWCEVFRKIFEDDKRSKKRTKEIIEWLPTDYKPDEEGWQGWAPNIMSPSSLRKKWDKLDTKCPKIVKKSKLDYSEDDKYGGKQ